MWLYLYLCTSKWFFSWWHSCYSGEGKKKYVRQNYRENPSFFPPSYVHESVFTLSLYWFVCPFSPLLLCLYQVISRARSGVGASIWRQGWYGEEGRLMCNVCALLLCRVISGACSKWLLGNVKRTRGCSLNVATIVMYSSIKLWTLCIQ